MLLRDLDWLLALAEHQHVTDTAAVLRTSQPTLSRALARVEAELGARVFERAPDGVHLTPTGEVVMAAARELTARYEQLLSDLRTRDRSGHRRGAAGVPRLHRHLPRASACCATSTSTPHASGCC